MLGNCSRSALKDWAKAEIVQKLAEKGKTGDKQMFPPFKLQIHPRVPQSLPKLFAHTLTHPHLCIRCRAGSVSWMEGSHLRPSSRATHAPTGRAEDDPDWLLMSWEGLAACACCPVTQSTTKSQLWLRADKRTRPVEAPPVGSWGRKIPNRVAQNSKTENTVKRFGMVKTVLLADS